MAANFGPKRPIEDPKHAGNFALWEDEVQTPDAPDPTRALIFNCRQWLSIFEPRMRVRTAGELKQLRDRFGGPIDA